MKTFTYCSKASIGTDFKSVLDILTISTMINKQNNISGMLVFDGFNFLQYIEGDEVSINKLKNNLLNDSRHQDIVIIDESFSDQRIFPEWGMGYVNNQESIKNILESITGSREFDPSILTPKKAILILLNLSQII